MATRGGLIPNFLANCYYKSEETLAIQNNVEASRQIFLYIGNHLQLVIPVSLKLAIIHNFPN